MKSYLLACTFTEACKFYSLLSTNKTYYRKNIKIFYLDFVINIYRYKCRDEVFINTKCNIALILFYFSFLCM